MSFSSLIDLGQCNSINLVIIPVNQTLVEAESSPRGFNNFFLMSFANMTQLNEFQ